MNARTVWGTVMLLFSIAFWNAITTAYAGAVVALVGIGLVILPAVAHHDISAMPPWDISVVLTLGIVGYSLKLSPAITQTAIYLALIAFTVLVFVELWVFSSVEMIPRFAGGFIVFAAMAAAGLWTIVRWLSDMYLGTAYLTDVASLMWDLEITTMMSLLGVPLFVLYFKRLEKRDTRDI